MATEDVNFSRVNFLLVDPDPNIRRITKSILRGFGVENIKLAESAQNAKAILMAGPIDFLLCDSKLSDVSGFDLVSSIRMDEKSRYRFMPIILMMGHTPPAHVEKARDCGANLVVTKPLSPSALYKRLAWVATDERPFIVAPYYVGPDRRFKNDAEPLKFGRRAEDSTVDMLGEENSSAENHTTA